MGTRRNDIDIAKWFAVMFVLVDHIQYYGIPVTTNFWSARVVWIAFFLPIFFISSGMTNRSARQKHFGEYVHNKTCGILVPYIIWCFMLNYSGNHDLRFFLAMLMGTEGALEDVGVNGVLWFLPSFFSASCLFYWWARLAKDVVDKTKVKRELVYLIVALASMAIDRIVNGLFPEYLFFGFKSAFNGAALMLIGVCIAPLIDWLHMQSWWAKVAIGVALFAGGSLLAVLNMPALPSSNETGSYQASVRMAEGQVGLNVGAYLGSAVLLSAAVLTFAMLIEKSRLLAYMGRHTFLYMTMHVLTFNISSKYLSPLLVGQFSVPAAGMIFLLVNVVILTCLFPLVDRYFPFLYRKIGDGSGTVKQAVSSTRRGKCRNMRQ